MASRKAAATKADWRTVFRQSIARSLVIAAAVALGLFTLFLALALITYDSTDAALNTAPHGTAANWMGSAGAWFADLGLSIVDRRSVLYGQSVSVRVVICGSRFIYISIVTSLDSILICFLYIII